MGRCIFADTASHFASQKGNLVILNLQESNIMSTKRTFNILTKLSEPTTWAGLFTFVSAFAAGGAEMMMTASGLCQTLASIALVFANEQKG